MMKKLLFAGLLGAAAVLGTGCADACEKASDKVESKFKDCDVEYTKNEDGEDVECTEELGNASEKLADCIDKLDCAKVKDGTGLLSCATAP